jgi:uncharacterized protein YjbJ (UPF0337 family)
MNKDQVKGRAKEVKGAIKETTGKAVGNKDMENEGSVEKSTGKVQAGYGDLKRDINKNI